MKKWEWQEELDLAKKLLSEIKGEFQVVDKNYIAFRFKADAWAIVAYPHRTSAGHHHLRIRLENAKTPGARIDAAKAMWRLAHAENSCTFNVNNVHTTWGEKEFIAAIVMGNK